MALESVPWFVGGGAEHSPDVARMVANAATSNAAGVLGNLDFRVTPLPVPGTKVRIAAGAAVIPNGYLAAPDYGKQSYIARAADVTDDTDVTATGSGAGRSDLVVVRIDDPQFGGQAPVDPVVGPYVRFEIIENVTPGTTALPVDLGYPAVVLARIDLPPSTGTVTSGHITDLRKVANPKRIRDLYNTQPTSPSNITSGAYAAWTPQANRNIVVPSWATQVKIIGHLAAVVCRNDSALAYVRGKFGAQYLQEVGIDMDVNTRGTALVTDTLVIPANVRGTTVTLSLEAHTGAGGPGLIQTDVFSTVLWDVEFLEVASSD